MKRKFYIYRVTFTLNFAHLVFPPSEERGLEFVQDDNTNLFFRDWLLMLQNLSFLVLE